MVLLNTNDYVVLSSARDKKNNFGLCKARGMTVKMLITNSKLSESTVRRSIKKLLEKGFIDYGVRQINKDTFYVTELGIEEITEIQKIIEPKKGGKINGEE